MSYLTAPRGRAVFCCQCGKAYDVEPNRCACGCLGFQFKKPEPRKDETDGR